jgi:regulator of cell morphogenesis and NO signaling
MTKFNTDQRIGDIVAVLPAAAEIFKEYGIDFCCGGGRPLAQAISEQNLDGDEIIGRLNDASEKAEKGSSLTDFVNMPAGELIDHIVNRHHTYVRANLPVIGEYAAKILEVHGQNHNELYKVHRLFSRLRMELEEHLIKEEKALFPLIDLYSRQPSGESFDKTARAVREVEAEHDEAGSILKELRSVTGDYTVPEDGCSSWKTTYEKLKNLESDLFLHIHLENNILFKVFN